MLPDVQDGAPQVAFTGIVPAIDEPSLHQLAVRRHGVRIEVEIPAFRQIQLDILKLLEILNPEYTQSHLPSPKNA